MTVGASHLSIALHLQIPSKEMRQYTPARVYGAFACGLDPLSHDINQISSFDDMTNNGFDHVFTAELWLFQGIFATLSGMSGSNSHFA